MLTFFGLAFDAIILSSGLKALMRGTKEGNMSVVADCSSAPGERESAAWIGGIKSVNSAESN